MSRRVVLTAILFLCMTLQPVVASIEAPNDSEINGNSVSTLSIDGYVTTKFASVGSEIDIHALTMGHSSNSIVSADIVQYDLDPLDSVVNSMFPGEGQFIDRVVLQSNGTHPDDSSIMTWEGSYTIPVTATGGTYGARIFVEDGNMYAVDDPTQSREVFRGEFEKILAAIDTAWDTANPLGEIAEEFEELETKGTSNGGWSNFVAVSTDGDGAGGSRQLWNSMLEAGRTQYNLSAGANFLEALMIMLDSDDADAGIQFVVGLMTYLDNMALPRTMFEFDDLAEYVRTYDAIENFTRFEGTGDFEAAYNAMLGSNEWNNMTTALDNLAEGIKPFESAQTLMRNIALLAVSSHPEAIAEGLEAWAEPLVNGDFENMTPFQKFVLRFAEMAGELNWETDTQDYDGNGAPDVIRWQYEYLLETTEGQAWTARMQNDAPWVNDAFDDFNTLPEDIIELVIESTENYIWESTGEVLADFGSWMNNASRSSMNSDWPDYSEEDDEDSSSDSSENNQVVFEELYPMQTTQYDTHLLEVGIRLQFDEGTCNWDNEVIDISMTNDRGYQVSTNLVKKYDWDSEYVGILLAPELESTSWTLSQPLEEYDNCDIGWANINVDRALRPSMIESMAVENNDEIFFVSAIGVLVDQEETAQVGQPYTVTSQTYDSAGIISDAEADIAILRISPQLGESAAESLSPEGEQDVMVSYPDTLEGTYTGQDLDGDLTIEIMPYGEYRDDGHESNHPQSYYFEAIEISSNAENWDASNYLPNERGLVDLVISGTTTGGIEFTEMKQMPLPGSLGCARTEGSADGQNVDLEYYYEDFYSDDGRSYYKPGLQQVKIAWGDGTPDTYSTTDPNEEHQHGLISHTYSSPGEYYIEMEFEDEYSTTHTEYIRYDTDQGFWQDDSDSEEGGYWNPWKWGSDCYLSSEESSTPSPQIIDNFLTDGPFEVVTEQIIDVNSEGEASLTFVPNHPGVYLTIVQSKGTLDNGQIKTGIGLNFAYITNGDITMTGLEQVTTFAGLPVYIADSANNGLNTISVTPNNIPYDEFNVSIGVAPLKLDVAFPDIDWDSISDEETFEIEFQNGDTSRNQEIRFEAPMSLIGMAVLNPEEQIMAEAIHFGVVIKDPSQLDMMGTLGPGQTTNIALSSEDGEANRIFAVAVPKFGFDPASIDFASFTSLIYDGIREDVGWVAEDAKSIRMCEFVEYNAESAMSGDDLRLEVSLSHSSDNEYRITEGVIDTSNVELFDSEGNAISPDSPWSEDYPGSDTMRATYMVSEGEYDLHTGTETNSDFKLDVYEGTWMDDTKCGGDADEDDAFELFDDFFSDVNSIAWGIGSSADLTLPHLASPTSNYTVLAMVQKGSGSSATIHAAIGSQIAEPNPEPLVMKDLAIEYMPQNPSAGDSLLITVSELETGIPVELLSVVVIGDEFTEFSGLTNYNGQISFTLSEGTFLVRASGGMYNPIDFTIVVTQDGSEEQTTEDTDGDNIPDVFDNDDDNDGVDDLNDLCPDTPAGDIVDENGCTIGSDNQNNGGQSGDGTSDLSKCEEWELLNPDAIDTSQPGNGCPHYEGDTDEKDTTSDTSENKILGMTPVTLGALVAGLILAIVAATVFVRRGGNSDDGDWYEQESAMFDEPYKTIPSVTVAPVSSAPSSPPPNHQGYMQDGYEVSEYPAGSGKWWWKDPQSGTWSEWK